MTDSTQIPDSELRKRRRERRIAWVLLILFLVLVTAQVLMAGRRETFGFTQSFLYFGLVNLNVLLIMFLVFLVSRNLIKAYLVRREGRLGSSLRWRLVTSLLIFSLIPSTILFIGSSLIIRQGFDKWFGGQVSKALSDAQAITRVHYDGIETNLEFFSDRMATELKSSAHTLDIDLAKHLQEQFPVQSVEFYFDLISQPVRKLSPILPDWAVPRAATESLQRALAGESFRLIRQYGDGDLVQVFRRIVVGERVVVLVVSHTVPLGLKTRIADLQSAFGVYQDTFDIKDTLKTNYTLILLTLFVLVIFVVSWFGLYIARSVTEPVSELLKGTEAFRNGQWDYRIPLPPQMKQELLGNPGADLEVLKGSFNLMAEEVGRRGRQLEEANVRLTTLVRELEDRERYLEILLSSIRRGVLVLDRDAHIRRINLEALEFASIKSHQIEAGLSFEGRDWREVFSNFGTNDEAKRWLEEAYHLRGQPVERLFEVFATGSKTSGLTSVRATGIHLRDERDQALGWMLILEDVTDAARLERLAAWQEVARRVAHEIKNPLTPIQISADRLSRRLGPRYQDDTIDGPLFKECLAQIQKQVRVIRDLVREFSQFAKLPEPNFSSLKIYELIRDVIDDYRINHPNVKFSVVALNEATSSLQVRADSEYIRRLVVNLADNAVHSLEESKIVSPEFKVVVGVEGGADHFLRIAFEDNGPGIPAHMRDKIFDPYVTSKASGTGLGLAIVRRIATEHMGRIRCEEAKGGRFVLELPLQTVGDQTA